MIPEQKEKLSFFKNYLDVAEPYKGGKAISEIKTKHSKIYKLSSNENPIGASPKAVAAIRHHLDNLHIYPDRTDKRLRMALQHFYDDALDESQFIAASSGSEIIDHIARAFAGEGLEVIISNPCFKPYEMFSSWCGSKVIDVPLLAPDFALDIEGILSAVNEKTRIIFLTSPNNPTGTHIPKRDLDSLLDRIPAHVILVLDEVYYHFADAEDFTTAMPYVQEGYNVIAINSFSKTYGLAAMRIGYGYTTKQLSNYLHKICKPFLIDTLSLEAGIAALRDHEFVKQTVETIKQGRRYLYGELDRLEMPYWKSQGNFIMMKPEISTDKFEDMMLEEGIMIRQVAGFGAPGCIRVTVGTQDANEAFIKALERVVKK